ncbi:MAG: exosortase [Candidatus Promineifilaceae bacterium]|jgi:exosortase
MTPVIRKNVIALACLSALLVVLFHLQGNMVHTESLIGRSAFRWMTARWKDKVSFGNVDYSHGYILPFVSLFFLWNRRHQIVRAPKRVYLGGILVLVAALLLHMLGMRVAQTRLSLAALILCLWSIPLYLYGPAVARNFTFPAAYLIFCIPLNFLNNITFPLRLFASVTATNILNGLGIEAVRSGSRIYSTAGSGFDFNVADPCSGLRSLLAITALTAAYAWMTQRGIIRKWLIFLASIPIALLANVFRIITVALVALVWGRKVATGFFHDYSGYVVFVFVVLIMIAAGKIVERLPLPGKACDPSDEDSNTPTATRPAKYSPPIAHAIVVGVLLLGCLGACSMMREMQTSDRSGVTMQLPETVGKAQGVSIRYCHNGDCPGIAAHTLAGGSPHCEQCEQATFPMSKIEKNILPPGTEFTKMQYTSPNGEFVRLSIVLSGENRGSIHRPQRCLIAQGFDIVKSDTVTVPVPDQAPIDVMMLHTTRPTQGSDVLHETIYAYWFVDTKRDTPLHFTRMFWMGWDALTLGTMDRWAYIAVVAPVGPTDTPDDTERKLSEFIAQIYPLIRTAQ